MDVEDTRAREGNRDDAPTNAPDDGRPTEPLTNFERLVAHLSKRSLATRLVTAYAAPGELKPADAVAKVAAGRLDELRRSYDKSKNKED